MRTITETATRAITEPAARGSTRRRRRGCGRRRRPTRHRGVVVGARVATRIIEPHRQSHFSGRSSAPSWWRALCGTRGGAVSAGRGAGGAARPRGARAPVEVVLRLGRQVVLHRQSELAPAFAAAGQRGGGKWGQQGGGVHAPEEAARVLLNVLLCEAMARGQPAGSVAHARHHTRGMAGLGRAGTHRARTGTWHRRRAARRRTCSGSTDPPCRA